MEDEWRRLRREEMRDDPVLVRMLGYNKDGVRDGDRDEDGRGRDTAGSDDTSLYSRIVDP